MKLTEALWESYQDGIVSYETILDCNPPRDRKTALKVARTLYEYENLQEEEVPTAWVPYFQENAEKRFDRFLVVEDRRDAIIERLKQARLSSA